MSSVLSITGGAKVGCESASNRSPPGVWRNVCSASSLGALFPAGVTALCGRAAIRTLSAKAVRAFGSSSSLNEEGFGLREQQSAGRVVYGVNEIVYLRFKVRMGNCAPAERSGIARNQIGVGELFGRPQHAQHGQIAGFKAGRVSRIQNGAGMSEQPDVKLTRIVDVVVPAVRQH